MRNMSAPEVLERTECDDGGLAVGIAAVADGEDFDGVAEIVEADAVVADAEPQLGWLDILEALDVAFAGGKIAGDGVEDAEGCWLVDSA